MMKNISKKVFLGLLTALMIVLCFGCGKKNPENKESRTAIKSVVFRVKCAGGYVMPLMKKDDLLSVAGEPKQYNEIKSCAFEGLDMVYTFSGMTVYVNELNGAELVTKIVLNDDTLKLHEGIGIGSLKSEVTAVYGASYKESNKDIIYEGKQCTLKLGFKDDKVIAAEIEYK